MKKTIGLAGMTVMLAAAAMMADVAGWRGDGTGVFPKTTPPTEWSTSRSVVWKTPLPSWSNASPILVGDRIFICAEPDMLICLNAKDGKILWRRKNSYEKVLPKMAGTPLPKTHKVDGYSSPTPVSDGKYVYAMYGMGTLVCYDMDGKLQWAKHYVTPNPHRWGYCTTPLLHGDTLVVHVDKVIALDAKTGREKWTASSAAPKWGSPVLMPLGDIQAVVTAAGDVINMADGKLLHKTYKGLTYNAPIVVGDKLYMIQHGGKAFEVAQDSSKPLWTTRPPKDRYYASPLYHDGILYAVTQTGVLSAIDAKTGEVIYSENLKIGRTAYPSIALAGELLFVSSDNGKTAVVKPGRTFQQVAFNSLEPFRGSPIFQGKRMYIRGMKHMYCIGK